MTPQNDGLESPAYGGNWQAAYDTFRGTFATTTGMVSLDVWGWGHRLG